MPAKSDFVFAQIKSALEADGPALVKKINGVIKWVVTPDAGEWCCDLKTGSGSVTQGPSDKKANLTIRISDDDLVGLAEGKLNPQQMFLKGKIKVKGNMGMAMKLNTVMTAGR